VRANTEKATVKKSDYITHVISKLATANAKLTVLAEGPVKDKQTGEIKTLKPACTNSICQEKPPKPDAVVDHELDAELQSLTIGGLQDFLAQVAIRKAEIEAGNI